MKLTSIRAAVFTLMIALRTCCAEPHHHPDTVKYHDAQLDASPWHNSPFHGVVPLEMTPPSLDMRHEALHGPISWPSTTSTAVHATHGILMTVAFVVIFPLGALATHVGPPGHCRTTFHVACQLSGVVIVLLGFVIGCWLTVDTGRFWDRAHQQFGTALVALTAIQPILGLFQHQHYLKTQELTFRRVIHSWYGRALMVMGIINAGLGLRMANNYSMAELVAYICIAGVMVGLYTFMALMDTIREVRADHKTRKQSHEPGQISRMSSSHSQSPPQSFQPERRVKNETGESNGHAPRVGFVEV